MERVFRFDPDGTIVGLYDDDLLPVLQALGPFRVERASHVEYDNERLGWTVEILNTKASPEPCFLPRLFSTRREALDAEVEYLQDNLKRD